MIDIFSHKQICCEHCGFGFFFAELGGAAKTVCPACGGENVLPDPPTEPVADPITPPDVISLQPETHQPEYPDLPLRQPEPETLVPCSVESCPLLTRNESADTAAAVVDQLEIRVLKRRRRRKTILTWTVTLQVCVLCGLGLFIAKSYLPKEVYVQVASSTAPMVDKNIIDVPSQALPLTALQTPLLENHSAHTAPVLNNTPSVPVIEPKPVAVSSIIVPIETSLSETAQNVVSPPDGFTTNSLQPYEVPAAAQDEFAASSDNVIFNSEPLPPPLPMEQVTLETADNLMESAKAALPDSPETCIEHAVRAAKIYDQFGHSYPASMYWILGSAFASLSWGEPLLESSSAVKTMALSPDNRYLLTQLADKKVWLWDIHNKTQEQMGYILDQGTAEYVKFVFTPDLRWIIGGQKDGTIRIWDMTLKNPVDTYVTFTERVPDLQDIQISPNGQWLAAFGHAPMQIVRTDQSPHGKPVQQVNYQRRDRIEQFSASPYPVLLWNLRQIATGIVPMAITVPSSPQPAQVVQFSPQSDRIAVGRRDSIVRVYDLTPRGINEEPFILRGHQLGITQIAFAPNGQWIATGSQDNTVRLWNLASSKVSPESATLYGHVGWVKSLTIDATGEHVFSGSYDRTIRIWNVKHNHIGTALKEEPIVLETSQGIPETLLVTPDCNKMIVLGKEGSLGIYHLPSVLASKVEEISQAISFHNSKLSISKCQITSDNLLLIFSYDHLANPANNGIRLWSLQPKMLVPTE